MFQIDLLRHGKTALSHTLRGSTDDALTAEGWLQMQRTLDQSLAMQRQWDVIVCSPLQRCHQFAAQAAEQLGLELMILPSLQEMHFGDWEAVEVQHLYDTEPKALEQFWLQPTRFSPPNAETMQDFENRVMSGLGQMLQILQSHKYQRALVVTHGGVIKLLKCKALNQPLDDILKMNAELGQLSHFEMPDAETIYLSEQHR